MVSEDFALLLIKLIKDQHWSADAFPELNNDFSEFELIHNLTQFIKDCKIQINEDDTLLKLNLFIKKLDDTQTRDDYLNSHEELAHSTPMNAGLLCSLLASIACTGPNSFLKDAYVDAFKSKSKYFIQWKMTTANLLNHFEPIPFHSTFTPLRYAHDMADIQKPVARKHPSLNS